MIGHLRVGFLCLLAVGVAGCAPKYLEPPKDKALPDYFSQRQFLNEMASAVIQDDLLQTVDVVAYFDPLTRSLTLGGPVRVRQPGTTPPNTVVRLESKPPLYHSALTNKWSSNANVPFLKAEVSDDTLSSITIQDIARLAVDKAEIPDQTRLRAAAGQLSGGQQLYWSRGALLTRIEKKQYNKIASSGTIAGTGMQVGGNYYSEANTTGSINLISLFLMPVEALPITPAPGAPPVASAKSAPRKLDADEPVRVIQGLPLGLGLQNRAP